jgi:hypothetical protein
LVDQFLRSVSRHSQRAEEQSALQDAVNFDLPIVTYEMRSVRRDDLDSATVVGELGRCGHSAIGVDVEIRRLLRHRDPLMPTRFGRDEARIFLGFGGSIPQSNRVVKQSDESRHLRR